MSSVPFNALAPAGVVDTRPEGRATKLNSEPLLCSDTGFIGFEKRYSAEKWQATREPAAMTGFTSRTFEG